jgi:hypothetical protein
MDPVNILTRAALSLYALAGYKEETRCVSTKTALQNKHRSRMSPRHSFIQRREKGRKLKPPTSRKLQRMHEFASSSSSSSSSSSNNSNSNSTPQRQQLQSSYEGPSHPAARHATSVPLTFPFSTHSEEFHTPRSEDHTDTNAHAHAHAHTGNPFRSTSSTPDFETPIQTPTSPRVQRTEQAKPTPPYKTSDLFETEALIRLIYLDRKIREEATPIADFQWPALTIDEFTAMHRLIKYSNELLPRTRIALLSSVFLQPPSKTCLELHIKQDGQFNITSTSAIDAFIDNMRKCTLLQYDMNLFVLIISALNKSYRVGYSNPVSYVRYTSYGLEAIPTYNQVYRQMLKNIRYGSFANIFLHPYNESTQQTFYKATKHLSSLNDLFELWDKGDDDNMSTIERIYTLGFIKEREEATNLDLLPTDNRELDPVVYKAYL